MDTFVEATEKFLAGADWLTDEDAPMVTGLRRSAQALDENFQAALLGQHKHIYVLLAKKRPKQVEKDPIQQAIEEARAGQ